MDCRTHQNQLMDLAAGTLAVRREAALRAHLARCAACRTALAADQQLVRALDAALRQELNPSLPPGLTARIRSRVWSESLPQRRWLPAWGVAAAFAALAGGFVVVQFKEHRTEPRKPASFDVARNGSSSESTISSGGKPLGITNRKPAVKIGNQVRPTSALRVLEPQVQALVPVEQEKAVARFLTGLQRGDVKGDVLLADRRNLVLPLREIAPLEFDPLHVKPLEIAQSDLH